MKILYLDTPLNPPGGGQISLINILKNARWESAVCLSSDGEFHDMLLRHGLNAVISPPHKLFSIIKKISPDIIHSNSAATRYTFSGAVISGWLGIPFIWHNRVIESAPLREKIIAALSSRIIIISDAVGEKFKSPWIKQKTVKIYNGVDTGEFAPRPHNDIPKDKILREIGINNVSGQEKIIGVFSRLERWKGHTLFLKAFAQGVRSAGFPLKALIVGGGGGDAESEIKALAVNSGILNHVIFAGYRRDVAQLMNICDVIVNPSLEPEPFGRTVIEAMSCGKPVIATNMGGPGEIIANWADGILTEPNPESMADAILRVISDDKLADRIGKAARQKVIKFFSIDRQIEELENLYKEVLTKP